MDNRNIVDVKYPVPSTDIILAISNKLDVSTDYLLKGDTKPAQEKICPDKLSVTPKTIEILSGVIKSQQEDIRYALETQRELVMRLPYFESKKPEGNKTPKK